MAKTKTKSRDDGGSMKRVVRVRYASSFRYADVLELYVEDQAFRQAVDSGRYALVDDKIVLNASKYIDYIDGHMELRSTIKDEDEYYCLALSSRDRVFSWDRYALGNACLQTWCTPPR